MEKEYKYWMIHNPKDKLPKVMHNKLKATEEAIRLAKLYPDDKFFILETVDCFLAPVAEPERINLIER